MLSNSFCIIHIYEVFQFFFKKILKIFIIFQRKSLLINVFNGNIHFGKKKNVSLLFRPSNYDTDKYIYIYIIDR